MLLPTELQNLISIALAEMSSDLQHRLNPNRRRQIYDAFGETTDRTSQQTRGWLAVLTAERVLPIFQQNFPEDTLPKELLETTVGILKGGVNESIADDMQDQGYHASGNTWGYIEEEMPLNADLAATAAYHALLEARGRYPFRDLQSLRKRERIRTGDNIGEEYWIDRMDEDLVTVGGIGDTAAFAAIASACRQDRLQCDPQELEQFWKWWLTVAIPLAWEASHNDTAS